ncbi:MAG: enoyl-CoA hydratase-related protein [Dehalococcoidia bacterium]
MANSTNNTVIYEKKDNIAYVTINRPEALNALNSSVNEGLYNAWIEIKNDPEVFVAIVTGAGGKAFSAGADLKEVNERQEEGLSAFAEASLGSQYIPDLGVWKPIIAAIDGFCVAGGLELAMQCDIRVASKKSQFGLPEPRWSIMPGYGLHYLTRMMPLGDALKIMLTGERVSSEDALRSGLIQEVVEDREEVMAACLRIAEQIKSCAPLAVQAIKEIAYTGKSMSPENSQRFSKELSAKVLGSEDAKEGPLAFTERRSPQWKMR